MHDGSFAGRRNPSSVDTKRGDHFLHATSHYSNRGKAESDQFRVANHSPATLSWNHALH